MDRQIELLKFDPEDFENFKRKNFQERLKFIDFLVDYISKTPNKVWSAQQKKIVDSKGKAPA
ncbi:MAG TPA: hypothetical protein VJ110_00415 [Candidatus Nanoarchaeia archaeon]|nr:hypothetical protein [Candidatus Nanoarchaeia archaeon]